MDESRTREPVLRVSGLCKRFGGLTAVSDCSFDVYNGDIVGLVGPNGSGKSTVFNLITNILPADAGKVHHRHIDITNLKVHKIARRGIGRTFQEVKIFRELTPWDNMTIVAQGRRLKDWQPLAKHLIDEMGLAHLISDIAGNLSVGQQRLLELAMQLLIEPSLLLLDEPLAGVHPVVSNRIAEIVRALREKGCAILLIEHDMRFVMKLCDRVVVMDHGEIIAEGPPQLIRENERVVNALLGGYREPAT